MSEQPTKPVPLTLWQSIVIAWRFWRVVRRLTRFHGLAVGDEITVEIKQ